MQSTEPGSHKSCSWCVFIVVSTLSFGVSALTHILPSEKILGSNEYIAKGSFGAQCGFLALQMLYIGFCLKQYPRDNLQKLSSVFMFELLIFSFLFLCLISNAAIISGIEVDQRHEYPDSIFYPRFISHIMRAICAALFLLWIVSYDMINSASTSAKKSTKTFLNLGRAFSCGLVLVETLRISILVPLNPTKFKNLLLKTDKSDLYFSIVFPAISMFWLRCFVKLCHGFHENDTTTTATASSSSSSLPSLSTLRSRCVLILGPLLIGAVYGVDLLDSSESIHTACAYGISVIVLSTLAWIAILCFVCRRDSNSQDSQIRIDIEHSEKYLFIFFAIMKLLVTGCNIGWFSCDGNNDGECAEKWVTIAAYVATLIVHVTQLVLLLTPACKIRLQKSISACLLLVALNIGYIWFDLSVEFLHLKHYITEYSHLKPIELFYTLQSIYWIGLEFHVIAVEIFITAFIKNFHKNEPTMPTNSSLDSGKPKRSDEIQ